MYFISDYQVQDILGTEKLKNDSKTCRYCFARCENEKLKMLTLYYAPFRLVYISTYDREGFSN